MREDKNFKSLVKTNHYTLLLEFLPMRNSVGKDWLGWDENKLEFVNKDLPHKTIDKLITFFERTEEYEKCSKLQKIKQTRLSGYSQYNL